MKRQSSSLVWFAIAAISLWCVTAAGAANIVTGTVDNGGQTTACTADRQSSVAPSSGTQGIQLASGSCQSAAAAPAPAAAGGGGGGGDTGQSSGTSSTDTATTSTQAMSSTTSRSSELLPASTRKTKTKGAAGAVLASQADGVRIAHVRFTTVGPAWRRRLMVVVALRDHHGRPIRAAVVAITAIAGARSTVSQPFLGFSGMLGKATFSLPVTASMVGERLLVRITARTPHASTWTLGAKRVPRTVRR